MINKYNYIIGPINNNKNSNNNNNNNKNNDNPADEENSKISVSTKSKVKLIPDSLLAHFSNNNTQTPCPSHSFLSFSSSSHPHMPGNIGHDPNPLATNANHLLTGLRNPLKIEIDKLFFHKKDMAIQRILGDLLAQPNMNGNTK